MSMSSSGGRGNRFRRGAAFRRRSFLAFAGLIALVVLVAGASSVQAVTIPANYFVVIDQGGANDVNAAQADLTQLGRDDSDPSVYKLFWSWDATNVWTGTGQTGDACALFDSDGDGNINFNVCGQITNFQANPNLVTQTSGSPFVFSCNDTKNDRCGNPSPVPFTPSQVQAGVLTAGAPGASPPGNLITDTDPFPNLLPDQNWPNDSTLEVVIQKSLMPAGATLVNVCSYPSAGNGGNNNPFDCIVNPGAGFLKIVKSASGANAATTNFTFTINPGADTRTITGSGTTGALPKPFGNGYSVAESALAGWDLTGASCIKEGGGTTGTKSGNTISGIEVLSGKVTTCTFTNVQQNPVLAIDKSSTTTQITAAGQVVPYTYLVSNNGNVALTGVTVADDKVASVSCPATTLAVGASMTCTGSHTVTQAEMNAGGNLTNIATADSDQTGPVTDTVSIPISQTRSLSITKQASPASYSAVGQVINYTITATNTGNVTLSNVTVSDPKVSGLSCTPANGSSLAPQASMTCTASHTIVQADLDAGHYANTACVNATSTTQACASADVPASKLAITKVATESSYAAVGDVIHYTIVATNNGQTTLNNVTVSDAKVSGLTCTPANGSPLAPNASMSCTATHTITQADLDAGHYANTACVNATGAAQQCASADVPAAKLTITKVATESTYGAVGDVVHYTIVATNTGQIALNNVTVSDPKVSGLSCTPTNGSSLAPGASMTCTATHTITQADLDAGHYLNQACVDDGPGGAAQQCASKDVPASKLAITKVASEASYSAVGQVIHYTIIATNTGQTTLANVTVSDPKVSGITCTPANGSSLAPGASMTCTATHMITQADLDAGHYANTACVNATSAAQQCASADVPAAKLTITKTPQEASYSAVGQVIHYTIVATNNGQTTLANVTVSDPKVSGITCTPANGSSLAPGASMTCSATHTITQADLDAGHYANTACVNATSAAQQCASADVPAAKLAITKVATESSYGAVGDIVHYTIVATNTGQIALNNVTVSDPKVSNLSCTPTNGSSLAPGASMTCNATHTITQADLDAGHYANTACVNATGATQACASKDVPAAKLAITKVAQESSYGAVGDVIHYTIVATNTGQIALNNVTVSDAKVTGLTCTPANGSPLAPGASMTCNATHTIVQADLDAGHYANTACVNATGATQACASADVPAAKLAITKVATESSYSAVGQVIHYTITATNTGQIALGSVTVSDPSVSGLGCTPPNGSPLAPSASMTCTATHTITQADLDAGHYFNQACVDDGFGGAAQQCASKDVPASKLTITKVATESSYSAVGQTIHYTIIATNNGQTMLTNVTVSDPKVTGISCIPANGSSLAAGASMTCTATHTITQADLDAGHYANTACVNATGAAQACASADVPAAKLAITKVATEPGYSAVGDIVHYTIVATNTGQIALNNVTVSDPKVSNLSCTPGNGSSLAPGATMTCTATHTITQADLDAGHYLNQACVNATSAAQQCASEDIPAVKVVTAQKVRLNDTAKPSGFGTLTGTVTFELFTSSDCTTGKLYDSGPVTLDGTGRASTKNAQTPPPELSANGTYYWKATYSGDANNNGSSSCNESTTISGNQQITQ